MAQWPIRWKLTAWYTLLLTAALVIFATVIYFGLRRELNDGLDEQLDRQALLIQRSVSMSGGEPVLDLSDLADPDDELFLRAWTLDGQMISESGGTSSARPLDQAAAETARDGQIARTRFEADGASFQVRTGPLEYEGEVIGILQVGGSREDVNDTLAQLRWVLVVAAPLLFLIAGGAGYLLAGRALAPVARITSVAGSIRGPDFGARLALDLPDDELGRLARTFDEMLGRIEEAFERQRRFTGDAAHELRTPLSLMRSRVDVVLAKPRAADHYRSEIERIGVDLNRLAGVVGSLLTLARSDSGQLRLDVTTFDLADVIPLVAEQYEAVAAAAQVDLTTDLSPTPLAADQDGLVQVLVNLVDNALAYSPSGGVVTIGCCRDGTVIRFWVEDTGVGIAPEHRERVFDRFYRTDAGRNRATGGVGLGLSISRAIVEAHGGSIRVALRDAAGTRIEVELPAGSP